MKELQQTFEHFANKPFIWGKTDCCQFASHYINLVTGLDLASTYGEYDSAMGAAKAQVKHGTFEGIMDEHFETVEPNYANGGDVVMIDTPNGLALGVLTPVAVWAMTESEGLTITNSKVVKAWRLK